MNVKKEDWQQIIIITCAFLDFLHSICSDKEHVPHADNCSSQNKCWVLHSTLVKRVNSVQLSSLQSITLQYFKPGHSFMAADSALPFISKKIKSKFILVGKWRFLVKLQIGSQIEQIPCCCRETTRDQKEKVLVNWNSICNI